MFWALTFQKKKKVMSKNNHELLDYSEIPKRDTLFDSNEVRGYSILHSGKMI